MSDKQTIMDLRNKTGAGIMDIKEALEESKGDEEKALEHLRKKGQKIAAKRAHRETGEGWVGSYVHANGKVAAQVKLMCETDFVARNKDFQQLAYAIAMHITAADPSYAKPEDVPEDIIAKEKEIYQAEVGKQGKSGDIAEKIIQGKLDKFYDEVCLVNQKYIKDDSKTIQQLLDEATAKIGEKIEVGGFSRLQI
jgi:elongation factor Ts